MQELTDPTFGWFNGLVESPIFPGKMPMVSGVDFPSNQSIEHWHTTPSKKSWLPIFLHVMKNQFQSPSPEIQSGMILAVFWANSSQRILIHYNELHPPCRMFVAFFSSNRYRHKHQIYDHTPSLNLYTYCHHHLSKSPMNWFPWVSHLLRL